jgi:hypothetical protein
MGTAQAVLVTHDSTTVLFDDFEGVAAGGYPDASIWEILFTNYGTGSITVLDSNSAGPGAFQGSQYIEMKGDPNGVNTYLTMEALLGGLPDPTAVGGGYTTGSLHSESMIYVTGSGKGGIHGHRTSGTSPEPRLNISRNRDSDSDGEANGYSNDTGYADFDVLDPNGPGVPIVTDQWQKWEIDVNLNTADDGSDDTWTVTIDGNQSGSIATWRNHPDVGRISFGMTGDFRDTWYLDAVPEPSSILIFGCGLFALIMYGCRRRFAK